VSYYTTSHKKSNAARFGRHLCKNPLLPELYDIHVLEVVLDDLGRVLAVLGHCVGAPLRKADAVAEAAPLDRDLSAVYVDRLDQRALHLVRAEADPKRRRGDGLSVDDQRLRAAGAALLADLDGLNVPGLGAGVLASRGEFLRAERHRPLLDVVRRVVGIRRVRHGQVRRVALLELERDARQLRLAARVRVEPRLRELALIAHHEALRLLDGLADVFIDVDLAVRLRLADVRGDVRALVLRVLRLDEFQNKRAGEDRLRLQRLRRPVVFHLAREHAHHVGLQIHLGDGLRLGVVDLQNRHAALVRLELFGDFRLHDVRLDLFLVRHVGLHAAAKRERHREHKRKNPNLLPHVHHPPAAILSARRPNYARCDSHSAFLEISPKATRLF